jgi:nonsense-mediated mRNA decay protein 3
MVRDVSDKHALYFEAVLQLRDVSPQINDYVIAEIQSHKIHVAKVVKAKNGQDLYLADNQFTKSLGKRMQQKFGGRVLTTASLHTRIKGKEVYRVTVLYRGIPFKKGDEVDYQGEKYMVKAVGKDVLLIGIDNPGKVHVNYKDVRQIRVV